MSSKQLSQVKSPTYKCHHLIEARGLTNWVDLVTAVLVCVSEIEVCSCRFHTVIGWQIGFMNDNGLFSVTTVLFQRLAILDSERKSFDRLRRATILLTRSYFCLVIDTIEIVFREIRSTELGLHSPIPSRIFVSHVSRSWNR